MNNKVLIILSDKFSSDEEVKKACNELILITNSEKIDYYYDKFCSYFTFNLDDPDYELITDCLYSWLGENGINYLMVSPDDRNNIDMFPPEVYKTMNSVSKSEYGLYRKQEMDDFEPSKKTEIELMDLIEFFDDDDDDTEDFELRKLKNRKKETTIDEILDKISTDGLKSLTDDELKILKKKSRNK